MRIIYSQFVSDSDIVDKKDIKGMPCRNRQGIFVAALVIRYVSKIISLSMNKRREI